MYIEERFLSHVEIGFESGCWKWVGCKNKYGYGFFRALGKNRLVHRVSYWLHHGTPPPPWMCVCHSCDNPSCVNPAHLWLGTQSENIKDCVSKNRQALARKTHCPKGHPYSGDNLSLGRGGWRICKACAKANNDKRYPSRKPSTPGSPRRLKTHCKQGHEYSVDNVKTEHGHRVCIKCSSEWKKKAGRKYRQKIKSALAEVNK